MSAEGEGMDEDMDWVFGEPDEETFFDAEDAEFADDFSQRQLEEAQMNLEVHCAMIAEKKYNEVLRKIKEEQGDKGILALLFALERAMGWQLEIVASRDAVDDTLISKYNTFDENSWQRVRNTKSFERMIYDVNFVSRRGMNMAIREAVSDNHSETRNALRNVVFALWKVLDSKLS